MPKWLLAAIAWEAAQLLNGDGADDDAASNRWLRERATTIRARATSRVRPGRAMS